MKEPLKKQAGSNHAGNGLRHAVVQQRHARWLSDRAITISAILLSTLCQTIAAAAAEPAQIVSTMRAGLQDWQPTLDAVGNLRAERGVNLAFEASGIVSKINFVSGQSVAAGDVLAQLRLNDEPGRLAQLKAQARFASVSLARDARLLQSKTTSNAVVDQDQSNLLALMGQIDAQQAMIAEKTLAAPFAGQLGIRQIDLGEFLTQGTFVVTLQSLDPIDVDFYIPQQQLRDLRVGMQAIVTVDGWGDRAFTGKLQAITPQVDQASRTVVVRAQIENHDHALIPGMFASVRVGIGVVQHHVTLPISAISATTYGSTVYVIRNTGKDRIAHQLLVTTGPERGDQVAILSGLSPGEEVVTAGQLKLHEGTPVVVNNAVQPDFAAHPQLPQE